MFEPVIQEISIPDNIILRQQSNVLRKVSCVDGILTTNERIDRNGLNARAHIAGLWGVSSSSHITVQNAKLLVYEAIKNAKMLSCCSKEQQTKKFCHQATSRMPNNNIPRIGYVDVAQAIIIEYVKRIDKYISSTYKNICTRRVMIYVDGIEKFIRTHIYDDLLNSTTKRTCIYIEMGAYNSEGVVTTVAGRMGVPYEIDYWHTLMSDSMIVAERVYKRLIDKTQAQEACKGIFPCILHPDVAGILAHESIGHNVEADMVGKGSFVTRFLGNQIASEKVSITDFAHTAFNESAGLPLFVDDEGTICRDVSIIEKGKLVGYLHDCESAKRYHTVPSGNSRAYLAFDEPLIRMRNTALHPGVDRLADMISSIDHGYYLLSSGGGQADSNGEFIFNVDMGYEIKNGKLSHAIKDTTISGNAVVILSSITMVSNDFIWDVTGLCSKFQSMILATGGPYVKCNLFLGKE